jgi:hypothetical protein
MSIAKAKRIESLAPNGIPRWIRCYDDGKMGDRFTVVYTGKYKGKMPGWCQYVGMSAAPFHPQGVCQHGEHDGMIDVAKGCWAGPAIGRSCHLGKRIRFEDLPEDCQRVVWNDYSELWNIPNPMVSCTEKKSS